MQQRIKLILFLTATVLAFSGLNLNAAEEVQDGILAVVNDDVITLSDLSQYLNSRYAQLKLEGKPEEEIRQTMSELQENGLNKLIEEKLILAEANKKGIVLKEDLVDKRLDEIKSHYASEDEFMKALTTSGATVTDLRKKIADQFKIKYFIDDEVRSKIYVNPQEVTDYYTAHQEQFIKPERADLDSIYLTFTQSKEEAEGKVTEILAALKTGTDFNTLAQKYSQAASIGSVTKGEMLPLIENAIFQLKEGEVSAPLEVAKGIYIFKLKKKYPREVASIEDVKKQITDFLFQARFQENYREWVEKLKKKAFVEIKQ